MADAVSGPLPLPSGAPSTVLGYSIWSPEGRGQEILAYTNFCANEDRYQDPDGWARFNREIAPQLAGQVIADVLSYVSVHAGGPQAVVKALDQLAEIIDADESLTQAVNEAFPS